MARGNPDIFLSPGEFWFGGGDLRIGTLLGSCVAITFWHPALDVGGMCHYLLPHRPGPRHGSGPGERSGEHQPARHAAPGAEELDGRYAHDAVALFLRSIERAGTRPADYQVKLFGGGTQFLPGPRTGGSSDQGSGWSTGWGTGGNTMGDAAGLDVPARNVAAGLALIAGLGLPVTAHHLGGHGPRQIVLDLPTGAVWVRHAAPLAGSGRVG